jgi:hypothetical protein
MYPYTVMTKAAYKAELSMATAALAAVQRFAKSTVFLPVVLSHRIALLTHQPVSNQSAWLQL